VRALHRVFELDKEPVKVEKADESAVR